jgi:hypothetical protein
MMRKNAKAVTSTLESIFKELDDDQRPKSILADQDKAYLNPTFQQLMNDNEIAFNTNALKDHRALGIIDNFAKRIKLILTRTFSDNKKNKKRGTKWIDILPKVQTIYNKAPNEALGGHSPYQVIIDDDVDAEVRGLNVKKNIMNAPTTSDLVPGDTVRKNIQRLSTTAKGTDPSFSDKVFKVVESKRGKNNVEGSMVYLDDGTKHRRHHLLKVPNDTKSATKNESSYQTKDGYEEDEARHHEEGEGQAQR